ncbi:MAG: RagB/SusD family nutrient uptake outer membrane protein [Bacteroidota bacterium]
MKKIYIIPLFLITVSCSDFLEQNLVGQYSTDTFYRTGPQAEIAITGVYNAISFTSSGNALWVFGDVVSDDAIKGGNATDQNDISLLETFNYTQANEYLDKIWRQNYEAINRANMLLYYMPRIDMDDARKAEITGEAEFIRAYCYFHLSNIFGSIPLRTEPLLSPEGSAKAKSSVDDIQNQIEKDLTDALTGLKISPTHFGGVSQGAAYGLLAKLRLFRGQWQSSLDAIDALEKLGVYALRPLYTDSFRDSAQNNNEDIFEIQQLRLQNPSMASFLNQYFGAPAYNGYFFNQPTQGFVNAFEMTADSVYDPRLHYTVRGLRDKYINGEDFDPRWSSTGYLNIKHEQPISEVPAGTVGESGLDYVYMRYAEVLLMKAEALNELSRTAEALAPLNAVRKRARESYLYDKHLEDFGAVPTDLLPDVALGSQSQMRDAIRHERRVELGFEFHRYFDLLRYGKVAAEDALQGTGFSYDKNRYFSIPISELQTNLLINQ